jgi:hypothetical protein
MRRDIRNLNKVRMLGTSVISNCVAGMAACFGVLQSHQRDCRQLL